MTRNLPDDPDETGHYRCKVVFDPGPTFAGFSELAVERKDVTVPDIVHHAMECVPDDKEVIDFTVYEVLVEEMTLGEDMVSGEAWMLDIDDFLGLVVESESEEEFRTRAEEESQDIDDE
jgi:hypothetical protein